MREIIQNKNIGLPLKSIEQRAIKLNALKKLYAMVRMKKAARESSQVFQTLMVMN